MSMLIAALAAIAADPASGAAVQPAADSSAAQVTAQVTAGELFALADRARDSGDLALAEQLYRALATDPDQDKRSEARFRLAQMLANQAGRTRDAAVLLRQILDEQPGIAPVRLELARVQALLGNLGAAQREMRAASAAGLPPDVERLVRTYVSALALARPVSFSAEVAVAPDSNINRATRSDTLGTVIGDFTLSDDAQARSGIGLALRGQAAVRLPVSGAGAGTVLVARSSASGDIYRASQFTSIAASLLIGPEYRLGRDRLTIAVGPGWRWYGMRPYSASITGSIGWAHPIGTRAQLRADAAVAHVTDRFNDAQSGTNFNLTLGLDRAISARAGVGGQIGAARDGARDPGFATASATLGGYAYREFGQTTVAATFAYGYLDSDARLLLYPRRRSDHRLSTGVSANLRALRLGALAPVVRLGWERNVSTVELFDYSRLSGQIGVGAAF